MSVSGEMPVLTTPRLTLEPLRVEHAEAMFEVLREPLLHRHIDAPPPSSVEQLRHVYARRQTRRSPDGTERWFNWIVRPHGQPPIGFVQATVLPQRAAWIAYLLGSSHWGRGFATEATAAMLDHLIAHDGVERFLACVERANRPSIGVLERLGFQAAPAHERVGRELTASERLYLRDAKRAGPDCASVG